MKERPILFSALMVRAILEGRKTQTRRVVKRGVVGRLMAGDQKLWPYELTKDGSSRPCKCPYGVVGNRLWVKETHRLWSHSFESIGVEYTAGGEDKIVDFPNKADMPSLETIFKKRLNGGRANRPSIFMHRWAARITLLVNGVRVERLQEISEGDAEAEGCFALGDCECTAKHQYRNLWETINGKGSWEINPWVWVIEFRRINP